VPAVNPDFPTPNVAESVHGSIVIVHSTAIVSSPNKATVITAQA
jgi:hypothetical protein